MTEQELQAFEQMVREHKCNGASSNITVKVSQLERLIAVARKTKHEAEIFQFNVAAEIRKDEKSDWRYKQRWASYVKQQKLQKELLDKRKLREQRREKLIARWKSYAGSQKQNATN